MTLPSLPATLAIALSIGLIVFSRPLAAEIVAWREKRYPRGCYLGGRQSLFQVRVGLILIGVFGIVLGLSSVFRST